MTERRPVANMIEYEGLIYRGVPQFMDALGLSEWQARKLIRSGRASFWDRSSGHLHRARSPHEPQRSRPTERRLRLGHAVG